MVPTQLLGNDTLTPLDTLVFAVIYWFCRLTPERICFASNDTIAVMIGDTTAAGSVKNSIRRLARAGFITREPSKEVRRIIRSNMIFSKVSNVSRASNDAVSESIGHQVIPTRAPDDADTIYESNKKKRASSSEEMKRRYAEIPAEFKRVCEKHIFPILKETRGYPFDEIKDMVLLWDLKKRYGDRSLTKIITKWSLKKNHGRSSSPRRDPRQEIISWVSRSKGSDECDDG